MRGRHLFYALLSASLLCTGASALTASADPVTISDTVLSDAIHDALGIDRWEELTTEQLDEITELRIDNLQFAGYYKMDRKNCLYGCDLDLKEIGNLENLETLYIDNAKENNCFSSIYGFSGLTDCKNLKELKVTYNCDADSQRFSESVAQSGAKVLEEIVEGCESLEHLDLGILPSEEVLQKLQQANPDLVITGGDSERADQRENEESAIEELPYGSILTVSEQEDLDNCENPENIKAVFIRTDCDISGLAEMPNINTVVISGYQMGMNFTVLNVTDFDVVKDLPHLNKIVLNSCSIDADTRIFDEVKGLRTLGYYNMSEPLATDLEIYGQIKDFGYRCMDVDAVQYISEMPNLRSLVVETRDIPQFAKVQETLAGTEIRSFKGGIWEKDSSDQHVMMAGFNGMRSLRNLYLTGNVYNPVSWDQAEPLEQLEALEIWLKNELPQPLTLYPELRTLTLSFATWTANQCEGEIDFTEAGKLEHLSYLGTAEIKAADWLAFDKTLLGRMKGMLDVYQNGVVIDVFTDPAYRERCLPYLT